MLISSVFIFFNTVTWNVKMSHWDCIVCRTVLFYITIICVVRAPPAAVTADSRSLLLAHVTVLARAQLRRSPPSLHWPKSFTGLSLQLWSPSKGPGGIWKLHWKTQICRRKACVYILLNFYMYKGPFTGEWTPEEVIRAGSFIFKKKKQWIF